MALTNTPVFVQTPKVSQVTIVNADASNPKTLVTAGANGSKIVGIQFCSDDTSDRVVQVQINRSGTRILTGSVKVNTLSGTDGTTPAVTGMWSGMTVGFPVDNDGVRYLFLQSGDLLEIKSTTTVTTAKTISATAVYGDF